MVPRQARLTERRIGHDSRVKVEQWRNLAAVAVVNRDAARFIVGLHFGCQPSGGSDGAANASNTCSPCVGEASHDSNAADIGRFSAPQ